MAQNIGRNQWPSTRRPPCEIMRLAGDFLNTKFWNKIKADFDKFVKKK
jgi:hypothetical protein